MSKKISLQINLNYLKITLKCYALTNSATVQWKSVVPKMCSKSQEEFFADRYLPQHVEWDLNKTSKTLTETLTALFLMA